jgi:hypothetical protein
MPFLPDIIDEATARAAAEKKQRFVCLHEQHLFFFIHCPRYADELRQQMISQLQSETPSALLRKDAR